MQKFVFVLPEGSKIDDLLDALKFFGLIYSYTWTKQGIMISITRPHITKLTLWEKYIREHFPLKLAPKVYEEVPPEVLKEEKRVPDENLTVNEVEATALPPEKKRRRRKNVPES